MIETLVIFGILAIMGIGALINENSQKVKNKKECDNYLNEHPEIEFADSNLYSTITKIKKDVPPCKKCDWQYMQLWNQYGSNFEYRCTDCKKKYNLNDKTTPNKIYDLNLNLLNVYQLLNKIEENYNEAGWERLKENLIFEYFEQRKGTPYIRAIEFEAQGTPNLQEEVSDFSSSRRISQKVKDLVWRRDEGKCVECGNNEKLEFDHIIPHSKGGSNTYRNIQLLCESCNRQKSAAIG